MSFIYAGNSLTREDKVGGGYPKESSDVASQGIWKGRNVVSRFVNEK